MHAAGSCDKTCPGLMQSLRSQGGVEFPTGGNGQFLAWPASASVCWKRAAEGQLIRCDSGADG